MELALFILGLISLIDVPFLLLRHERRSLTVYWGMLGMALIYCIAAALHWQFLSPTPIIEAMFRPLAQAFPGG